jgi:hypothetical protein
MGVQSWSLSTYQGGYHKVSSHHRIGISCRLQKTQSFVYYYKKKC